MNNEEIIGLIQKFLAKEITADEKRRLYQLLDSENINENQLSAYYEQKWQDAAQNTFQDNDSKLRSWIEIRAQLFPAKHRKIGLQIAGLAAIALLCIMLGYSLSFIGNKTQEDLIVKVENGQKANVQLPDGSLVWLNSASEIHYSPDFGKKKRAVKLFGEAYFEVKSNPKNPFVVQTWDNLQIRALGTKFNVKSYRNDNTITGTLLEGKIDVSNQSFSEILYPNDRIIYNTADNTFRKTHITTKEEAIFWLTGQFVFEGETLYNIAKILERMYNVNFLFDSPEIKYIKYSGKISNNSMENVLNLITTVSPLKYTMEGSTVIFSKK